jgi:hypothetical protein
MLGSRLCCFQKPALGPFVMNANVHLDSPRSESGRCFDAVNSVARDKAKANLAIVVKRIRKSTSFMRGAFHKRTALPP